MPSLLLALLLALKLDLDIQFHAFAYNFAGRKWQTHWISIVTVSFVYGLANISACVDVCVDA